jgi:hypothetical protein
MTSHATVRSGSPGLTTKLLLHRPSSYCRPVTIIPGSFTSVFSPHAQIRVGKGCRPRALWKLNISDMYMLSLLDRTRLVGRREPLARVVPGPLTFRIMLRVWSSMNSTRTWVTPPREPMQVPLALTILPICISSRGKLFRGSYRFGPGRG